MPSDFEPIGHTDIDLLNESLKKAREYARGDTSEEKLTAILLLVNHVEYVASDILRNLHRMIKVGTYEKFNGVISWPISECMKKKTLGGMIADLQEFNFPDREEFIRCLSAFNKKRNKLMHRLLESPSLEVSALEAIIQDFDNIFHRYRSIKQELLTKWPRIS
ncbi:MAG: hypothetical protein HYT49_02570 [Candidatus Wildermuthbacteria bacterium]|nr:hypothetical protein [Candidatus Wildermuthbacteria bacterium]